MESSNVAFFGTQCTSGKGTGIIFKTGDNTVIGTIANLSDSAEKKQTPLSIEIERFILIVSAVAIFLGVSFFLIGWIFKGTDLVTNLVFCIGIIVANVPEGLLATVTVSLALTAKRMAKKMVLVKNLESVETLGSTSCICSDKTGTLTQNRMSVSNMFFDGRIVDCSVNWQVYQKAKAKELAKPEKDQDINKVAKPEYTMNDAGFKLMVKTIALSTTSIFQYTPDSDEVRARVCKNSRWSQKDLKAELEKTNPPPSEAALAIFKEHSDIMIEEESKMNYIKRHVKGDASETGLLKFSQPILMKEYGGDYEDGLVDIREAFPVCITGEGDDKKAAEIPFSSDIKFNLLIRDSNMEVREPENAEENITVYIKGAPEKILNRCTRIIENGVEYDFDEKRRGNVDFANDTFGSTGERVLAFAKIELDPTVYNKAAKLGTPGYQFDVSTWKSWIEVTEYSDQVAGWFPMWDFSLCGLASLNDPPRPKVDVSVQKCKNAGIKVIMVTGDQPPTAAAIAFKVNIITKPDLEYNTMVTAW